MLVLDTAQNQFRILIMMAVGCDSELVHVVSLYYRLYLPL